MTLGWSSSRPDRAIRRVCNYGQLSLQLALVYQGYMDEKAIMSHNTSFCNLEQMNLSSRSPTRQYIVLRSQAIADQHYNASKKFKLCRKGSSTWYCWCFESTLTNDETMRSMSALPHYRCISCVTVKSRGNYWFLWHDCGFYDGIGLSTHFLRCWWNVFEHVPHQALEVLWRLLQWSNTSGSTLISSGKGTLW